MTFIRKSVAALLLAASATAPLAGRAEAQEESAADRQYREDYERVQKIVAISDTQRRADQLFTFLKERPDSKLVDYAQKNYLVVLEGLLKAENFKGVLPLAERYVKLRPKVPETYYFYGAALRAVDRHDEAYDALARCSVVRNPLSRKARDLLEFVYRSKHQGLLGGLDKILKKAQADMAH